MQDRRRHRRLPLRLPVTCREAGVTNGRKFAGRTINVSPGGMLIDLGEAEFSPGRVLTVEVTIPPTEGLLEFGGSFSSYAKVLRKWLDCKSRAESDPNCFLAVEFCQLPRLRT